MALSEEVFGQFVINAFGEPYLPSLVRESFSQTGSHAAYERSMGETLKREKSLLIFLGSDGGLLLRHLADKTPQKSSRYLVVEFPELLAMARREGVIPQELPRHINLCTPEELPDTCQKLNVEDYFRLNNVFLIQSTATELGVHPEYRKIWKDANLFMVRLKFELYNSTGVVMNFLSQTLKNLPENRLPATVLNGLFPGMTAVLLGGGPSLAEMLPWVKANRDKLVVLAVARIAGLLDKEGVFPEFYFAIDPYDLSFYNSREILAGPQDTVLVGAYHMNARLLGQWGGRYLYMGKPFPWQTPLNPEDNDIFLGTTVAHQAVGTAMRMGISRLVLAGVDLCFTKEGITHTKGTLECQMGPWIPSSDLSVETNEGGIAETWYDLYYDIPRMGILAGMVKEQGCEVINPAATAAKIPNVRHMALAEIALQPLPYDPKTRIAAQLPPENSRERSLHYKKVIAEINKAMTEVRKIGKLAREALDCNDRFFGRLGQPPDFSFKKRMDAIEELYNTRHKVMSTMVREIMIESFLGLSQLDKEQVLSDEEVEEIGHKYYKFYLEGTKFSLDLLEKTRARLASRLNEEHTEPDLPSLAQQWLDDQQPGRYRVFLQRKGLTEPPDAWRQWMEPLQQRFQEDLVTQNSDYRKQFDVMLTPTGVLSKIMGFYQDKAIERLRSFGEGLSRSNLENFDQFNLLIQGYIHDLENNTRKAAQYYRQITLPFLQEEGMRGLLTIALREGDLFTARAVLTRLTTNAPIFYNYLAEILRISGDLPKALATYQEFLKYLPDDPVTLMKIARLQLELRQWAAGRATLQQVLEKHPTNHVARALFDRVDALNGHAPNGATPAD